MIGRLFALIVAVTVLAGVAGMAGGCASKKVVATEQSGPAIPAELQFTVETLDGHQFSGDSLVGKPAVLWFWAPWCPACRAEAPSVARAVAANPWATFVGVGSRDDVPSLQKFTAKYGLNTFTELADTDGVVWAKFGITRQPAYAFIHSNGSIEVVKGGLAEYNLNDRVHDLADR